MNRERKTKGFAPPVVGGSSLLVMFAVLCLTTFAVLSLSTVKAGDRLSDGTKESVSEYYAADFEAERILARLRSGEIPEGVAVEGTTYRYTCPMSESQELQVTIVREGETWSVARWATVSLTEWTTDETIDVWDGELPTKQQEESQWN